MRKLPRQVSSEPGRASHLPSASSRVVNINFCFLGVDELPHKFAVCDIRALATARDCPHMKDARKTKTAASLAFSLLPEQSEQESLNFVAPTEKVNLRRRYFS